MSFTTILSIDPGASGGLAWNSEGVGIQACAMPRDEEMVIKLIREILQTNASHPVVAYIELVTGYAPARKDQNVCPVCNKSKDDNEPGSRMFKFGRGVGLIIGALRMAGIEPTEVAPRTWQKPFYVNVYKQNGARKSRSERKRILHDIAQRRFPQLKVTLKTADALLIHAYATMQVSQSFEALGPQDKPSVPVPFLSTHAAEFEQLKKKLVPGAGKVARVQVDDRNCNRPDDRTCFIGNWKGQDYVFRNDPSGAVLLHKADPNDLAMFPRGTK